MQTQALLEGTSIPEVAGRIVLVGANVVNSANPGPTRRLGSSRTGIVLAIMLTDLRVQTQALLEGTSIPEAAGRIVLAL